MASCLDERVAPGRLQAGHLSCNYCRLTVTIDIFIIYCSTMRVTYYLTTLYCTVLHLYSTGVDLYITRPSRGLGPKLKSQPSAPPLTCGLVVNLTTTTRELPTQPTLRVKARACIEHPVRPVGTVNAQQREAARHSAGCNPEPLHVMLILSDSLGYNA